MTDAWVLNLNVEPTAERWNVRVWFVFGETTDRGIVNTTICSRR
jgi:hypothetical protein